MVARAVGCRFEGQIANSVDAKYPHLDVFRFHDVAALADRRHRLARFVLPHGKWVRRDGERFAKSAAGVGRYRKLDAIRNANFARVPWTETGEKRDNDLISMEKCLMECRKYYYNKKNNLKQPHTGC